MQDPVEVDVSLDTVRVIRTIIYGTITLIVIIVNAFAMMILPKIRMQSSIPKLYLYSLTIADLCTGIFLGTLQTITSATDRWIFGDIMCAVAAFLRISVSIAALLLLLAVTIDRYLAIAYPLHYPILMTRKKAFGTLVSIWTVGACFTLIYGPLMGRPPTFHPHSVFCFFTTTNPDTIDFSIIICTTLFIVLPFITTIFIYTKIYSITRSHTKFASQFIGPQSNHVKKNMKFVKTFLLVILCFGIAWLPSVIIRYIQQLSDITIPSPLFTILEILIICNSGVNVFIYCWQNQDFRKATLQQMNYLLSNGSNVPKSGDLSGGSRK